MRFFNQRGFTAACLMSGALSFWLAWYWMPLPGTTDPIFILHSVERQREWVWASCVAQTLSSVLLVAGLVGYAALPRLRGALPFAGAVLGAIGATGVAADAIYHLLAYEMVQPGLQQQALLPVMRRFQTIDLGFLIPQTLAFFAGVYLIARGAMRAGAVSRWAPRLCALALLLGCLGGTVAKATGHGQRLIGLGVLGLVSLCLAWVGAGLVGSETPAAPSHSAAALRARAIAWIDAWNRRDIEAILEHYADDVAVCSPRVIERLGAPDGWLHGKAALRGYFAVGLRKADLRFELIDVAIGVHAMTVVYRRENGILVTDCSELDTGGRIRRMFACYSSG